MTNNNDTIDSVYARQTQITANDFNSIFFNETKMKQKLKREWINLGNKFQSENDENFNDNNNSFDIFKDSKYYLNSSNILPNIDNNNQYNTSNKDFLPMINKKDKFYKSQMNLNNRNNNASNNSNSQIGSNESKKNFYVNDGSNNNTNSNSLNKNRNLNKQKTQKLNFNSIYPYNLKSDSDLVEKIRTKDKENFMNNNNNYTYNNNNNTNNSYNNSYQKNPNPNNSKFFGTENSQNNLYDYSNNINNIRMKHINNNTYSNDTNNNNNSLGFKFNNSSYNNNINYVNLSFVKLDTYDLGVLLLYCILGGFDLIDLSNYECKHTRSDNCCCLLHCYYKYEKENSKNYKLKLKLILKKYTSSLNFEKFICALTSYKIDKNLSIDNLKQHFWLNGIKKKSRNFEEKNEKTKTNFNNINENEGIFQYISENLLVEMKEIFRLSNEINSKGSIVSISNNKKKFEKFLENFGNIITKSHYYFKQYNIRNFNQVVNKNNHIDFISQELNLEREYVYEKLRECYDNYFLNENLSQNEHDESKNFN